MKKRVSPGKKMLVASAIAATLAVLAFVLATDTGGAGLRFGLFVWIYLAIAFVFMRRYKGTGSLDLFSPAPGLVVLLFLYSVASALYVETKGTTNYGDSVNASVMTTYYISCILGLAGIVIGVLAAQRWKNSFDNMRIGRRFRINDSTLFKKLVLYSLALTIIFFAFIYDSFDFTQVPSYAEKAFSLRIERREVITSGLSEVFFIRLPISIILFLATLLMIRTKALWAKFLGGAIFGAYFLTNTLAGWRGNVISVAIIPFIFYHYRIRHISKTVAVIGIVSAYLFINGLSLVRFTSAPMQMLDAMREEISYQGLTFAKLQSSGELLVGTNLMRLISGLEESETDFTYGHSVLTELLLFIPRAIYPNRPLSLSEKFVDLFYPRVYDSGGGYGFFILQEGYWAFGLVGVFVFLLIYGWSVHMIYQWFMKNIKFDCVGLMYSGIYYSLVLSVVRTGIIGSYKSALMSVLPFILLIYLPSIKIKHLNRGKKLENRTDGHP